MQALNVLLSIVILGLLLKEKGDRPQRLKKRKIVVDTSALIDGRLLDVIKSGFLDGELLVSESVMFELQALADGRDGLKRERARRGLDIISELQQIDFVTVSIEKQVDKKQKTDEALLDLASKKQAALCTTDYTLNKLAVSKGIVVLNMHELLQNLGTIVLPKEELQVKLIQRGEQVNQSVGYLPDGTMVVVDQTTAKMRNKTVTVIVQKVLQSKAGKMIFATLKKT